MDSMAQALNREQHEADKRLRRKAEQEALARKLAALDSK